MKLRVVVTAMLLTLLLSGCSAIDKAIDDTIPLQNMAFISFSQEAAQNLLLPLKCLIPIALIGAISGIKKQNWRKVSKMFGLMLGIGALPYILPAIEGLGRATWPKELTLSWIATQLGWTFPIPVGDANPLSFIWALSMTLNWPLFHAVMQIAVSAVLVISMTVAVMTWSWRPLLVGVASVGSWVIAPSVIKNVIELLGSIRPDNAVSSTLIAFNLIYLVGMLVLGLIVYFAPPILVMAFMPVESASDDSQAQDDLPENGTPDPATEEGHGIPFVWPFWGPSPDGNEGGNGNSPVQPDDSVIYVYPSNDGLLRAGNEPIEGVYRTVDPGEDELKSLPEPAAYGEDGRNELDDLPVMETDEVKSGSASADAASIVISDQADENDILPAAQTRDADSIVVVESVAASSTGDPGSAEDDLPAAPLDDAKQIEETESLSGSDLFEGTGTIVIGDEE